MASNDKDNPDANCMPMGLTQFHQHNQPRKIMQNSGLIAIMYEANYGLRYIYIDGRTLPPQGSVQPFWYGYSIGRWDGDTLVVETTGFRDGIWLDRKGNPMTEAAKMTERFRRINSGNLEIEMTIDDPKAYTKPWTVKLHQMLVPDSDLLEYYCQENEKDASHLVGK